MMKWVVFFLFSSAIAREIPYMGRSPRAMLMGDAYTAVADDEYTLFYNPAALAKNKGFSFTGINPSFGLTNAYDDMDRFENFPSSDPVAISSRIMDLPLYFQVGAYPNLKMGHFGFSLFLDNQFSMTLRNNVHPFLDLNYRYDRGFVAGYALTWGTGGTRTKGKKGAKDLWNAGNHVSLGVSVKHFNREGVQNNFDLFGTKLYGAIISGSTDIAGIKNSLGWSTGDAWGGDIGMEYVASSGFSEFTAGLSVMDVFDTKFKKTSGSYDLKPQPMIVNSGVAFKQDFHIVDYTLSLDLHPLNEQTDFMRKLHVGAELSVPFVTFNTGYNEGYLSYGGSIKLWPIKLTLGVYGIEAGAKYKQQESKRAVLYLSLFDFSIDL